MATRASVEQDRAARRVLLLEIEVLRKVLTCASRDEFRVRGRYAAATEYAVRWHVDMLWNIVEDYVGYPRDYDACGEAISIAIHPLIIDRAQDPKTIKTAIKRLRDIELKLKEVWCE